MRCRGLSDYGKGTLAGREDDPLARAAGKPVLVDPKAQDSAVTRGQGDHAQPGRIRAVVGPCRDERSWSRRAPRCCQLSWMPCWSPAAKGHDPVAPAMSRTSPADPGPRGLRCDRRRRHRDRRAAAALAAGETCPRPWRWPIWRPAWWSASWYRHVSVPELRRPARLGQDAGFGGSTRPSCRSQ